MAVYRMMPDTFGWPAFHLGDPWTGIPIVPDSWGAMALYSLGYGLCCAVLCRELNAELDKEGDGLVASRGLVGGGQQGDKRLSDNQTFLVYVTDEIRRQYENKLLKQAEMVSASSGTLLAWWHIAGMVVHSSHGGTLLACCPPSYISKCCARVMSLPVHVPFAAQATNESRVRKGAVSTFLKGSGKPNDGLLAAKEDVAQLFKQMVMDVERNHGTQVGGLRGWVGGRLDGWVGLEVGEGRWQGRTNTYGYAHSKGCWGLLVWSHSAHRMQPNGGFLHCKPEKGFSWLYLVCGSWALYAVGACWYCLHTERPASQLSPFPHPFLAPLWCRWWTPPTCRW